MGHLLSWVFLAQAILLWERGRGRAFLISSAISYRLITRHNIYLTMSLKIDKSMKDYEIDNYLKELFAYSVIMCRKNEQYYLHGWFSMHLFLLLQALFVRLMSLHSLPQTPVLSHPCGRVILLTWSPPSHNLHSVHKDQRQSARNKWIIWNLRCTWKSSFFKTMFPEQWLSTFCGNLLDSF